MLVRSGSYAGSAGAQSITGVGFKPDVVIIKSATTQVPVIATSTMTAGNAKPLTGATAMTTGWVTSLDNDGFTVGTNAQTNANGVTFHYLALQASALSLVVTSYTGNGTSKTVSGIGFQPDALFILGESAVTAEFRSGQTAGDAGQNLSGAEGTTVVTSLNSDGFAVGTSVGANSNGVVYHVVALKAQPGVFIGLADYTGNGTSQTVTGAGFQPDCVLVKGKTGGTGIIRYKAETGLNSLPLTGSAEGTTFVTAFAADGFTVGSSANVNTNASVYHALAWREAGVPVGGGLSLLGVA